MFVTSLRVKSSRRRLRISFWPRSTASMRAVSPVAASATLGSTGMVTRSVIRPAWLRSSSFAFRPSNCIMPMMLCHLKEGSNLPLPAKWTSRMNRCRAGTPLASLTFGLQPNLYR